MTATATKSFTSAPKAERLVSFEPFIDGVAFIGMAMIEPRVRKGPKTTHFGYYLRKIETDFGVGFRLKKVCGTNEIDSCYDVNIDQQTGQQSCTCKGRSYTGRCKHVEAIVALIKSGKIDVPAAQAEVIPAASGACAACGKPFAACTCFDDP